MEANGASLVLRSTGKGMSADASGGGSARARVAHSRSVLKGRGPQAGPAGRGNARGSASGTGQSKRSKRSKALHQPVAATVVHANPYRSVKFRTALVCGLSSTGLQERYVALGQTVVALAPPTAPRPRSRSSRAGRSITTQPKLQPRGQPDPRPLLSAVCQDMVMASAQADGVNDAAATGPGAEQPFAWVAPLFTASPHTRSRRPAVFGTRVVAAEEALRSLSLPQPDPTNLTTDDGREPTSSPPTYWVEPLGVTSRRDVRSSLRVGSPGHHDSPLLALPARDGGSEASMVASMVEVTGLSWGHPQASGPPRLAMPGTDTGASAALTAHGCTGSDGPQAAAAEGVRQEAKGVEPKLDEGEEDGNPHATHNVRLVSDIEHPAAGLSGHEWALAPPTAQGLDPSKLRHNAIVISGAEVLGWHGPLLSTCIPRDSIAYPGSSPSPRRQSGGHPGSALPGRATAVGDA